MAFILRWTNPNTQSTVINIYRDTKDILTSALPAPIATLSNGETEWRDTTAQGGKTYYYLMTVTANGKTVAGPSTPYTIAVKRGMGPNTFIHGDDKLGFMGVVPYEERFDVNQLPATFQAMFPNVFTDRPVLLKFSYYGKILYVPEFTPAIGFASWAALYTNGLIYGRDDNGPEGGWGTLTPTKQDAKVIHKGDVYRMRVPRGMVGQNASEVLAFNNDYQLKDHDATDLGHNEFNDLMYAMVLDFPAKQRAINAHVYSSTYFGAGGVVSSSPQLNGGLVCMEHDSGAERVLHRGLFMSAAITTSSQVSVMQRINYVTPQQVGRYIPIFELVE
ncbi:putative virion structural protein [Erwinia phage vB_EamM_Asesino]|uniref:Virion structural protein n=1 Tax=Erwinia phage vB_EamM_Asesino TaxID=1883370 RepID=A0A1B2IAA5_9CAUD|nr:putative virion structural protein [Erwinia phage vB_EamM_Asesino]ANZ48176.1 putative virion structural protein [Erwinia phage vB_EamM_Asesino]